MLPKQQQATPLRLYAQVEPSFDSLTHCQKRFRISFCALGFSWTTTLATLLAMLKLASRKVTMADIHHVLAKVKQHQYAPLQALMWNAVGGFDTHPDVAWHACMQAPLSPRGALRACGRMTPACSTA